MPVTIVKVECPKHPGCYAMRLPCEKCITEEFRRKIDAILGRLS